MKYLATASLLFASAALAQPWQWELYEGDYYNPTGFPSPGTYGFSECFGDFDGDGDDDFVQVTEWTGTIVVTTRDESGFHWTTHPSVNDSAWAAWVFATNLDADAQDELIVYNTDSSHVWKAISFNPWTWERRDSLLEGVVIPEDAYPSQGVFGDFDGDGLLNGFFVYGDWAPSFELTERTSDGLWVTDTIFDSGGGVSSGIYSGDFDHDGDDDLAIAPLLTDVPPFSGFIENLSPGMSWHLSSEWEWAEFTGPAGGDLDGDSDWEGLYLYEGFPGFTMVEVVAEGTFIQITQSHYLGSLPGPVFSNFRVNGQTVVGAVRNWTWGAPFYTNDAFACMGRGDSNWMDFSSGFGSGPPWAGWQCVGGSRADLNGDGLGDILSILLDTLWPGGAYTYWVIWRNAGSVDQDLLQYASPSSTYFTHHFLQNPDTSFGYPAIGDITGDSRAELAVVAVPTDSQRYVFFYEMIGEILDTTFVLHPEWSDGLPTGFDRIRMADIDGDGLAELIAREQSGLWRTYFRRNGTWEEYTNILPPLTDANISFADADNDSDLDLFAGNQLWYSLSPSGSDDAFLLYPLSFILSAHPNPFNATTTISFDLPHASDVQLRLFDITGRLVRTLINRKMESGHHGIAFAAENLASGIYFCRLKAGETGITQKMVLLR